MPCSCTASRGGAACATVCPAEPGARRDDAAPAALGAAVAAVVDDGGLTALVSGERDATGWPGAERNPPSCEELMVGTAAAVGTCGCRSAVLGAASGARAPLTRAGGASCRNT